MIRSLVEEPTWLHALGSLPIWRPDTSPILLIAPHPDDETLGAGGLIAFQRARGVRVQVAAVTDGERAYGQMKGLGDLRQAEQADALSYLGVPTDYMIRLRLPDSDVSAHEQTLYDSLSPLVSKNTHIVAPWKGDFHPDHAACGRVAEHLTAQAGATLTSYFFWTWHLGTPALVEALPLRRFPLTPELMRLKTSALECHHSQLFQPTGDPILPESLLLPARRSFEVFATA